MTMVWTYSGWEADERRSETCPFCKGNDTVHLKDLQPDETEKWLCLDCEVEFEIQFEVPFGG